ncbi:hypothetical protein EVJ58_g4118 [Rhodofomes roseus]|uniref:Uncharacterized protein n=1 Tax=Rhodofomes roseus TaxID=34475 RepID=A0A4Y9YM35_9APHY|nr:hypothetical protein EVJ58_g4118 [Rhodofomes roseus]
MKTLTLTFNFCRLRMNAQRCEGLRGTLTEANVAETRLLRHVQDVFNRIWDVMPDEVINAVPELGAVWVVVVALLGILVPAIISQPYIEAELDRSVQHTSKARRLTNAREEEKEEEGFN